MNFDPLNWYWVADDGRLFSSARCELVDITDAKFVEWRSCGAIPTRWPESNTGQQTDAAIEHVLLPYGIQTTFLTYKSHAINFVNSEAERERGKFITPGDGQMMTYMEKIDQARSCLLTGSQVAENYPMLAAEVGITGTTLDEVATIVVSAYDRWLAVGSKIEATRRAANVAIESAGTRETVLSVLRDLVWP